MVRIYHVICFYHYIIFFSENGIFNWTNISLTLRSEDITLKFIVEDKWNFTTFAPVTIFYCGCRNASQCNFNVFQPKGTTVLYS